MIPYATLRALALHRARKRAERLTSTKEPTP